MHLNTSGPSSDTNSDQGADHAYRQQVSRTLGPKAGVTHGEGKKASSDNSATSAEALGQSGGHKALDAEIMDSLWPEQEPEKPPKPKPLPNAALVAARSLLRQLILMQVPNWQPGTAVPFPDVLILETPSNWIPAVEDVALDFFSTGGPADNGPGRDTFDDEDDQGNDLRRFRKKNGVQYRDTDSSAVVYRLPQEDIDRAAQSMSATIAKYIRHRRKLVLLTADDHALLPEPFRSVADAVWRLPALDRASLIQLAIDLTATPARQEDLASNLKDDISLEALQPAMLALALRPNQTPHDYLQRITKLLTNRIDTTRPANLTVTIDDLHGAEEFVAWARALAVDIQAYKQGTLRWDKVDRGALLWGSPGVGKTVAARAAALHCNIEYIPTSYGDWQSSHEGHLGDVIRAIRNVFQLARNKAPAIVFIDELDSVGSRDNASRYKDWWNSIINVLLAELDGAVAREGVVVIGATNHLKAIDPAIRRAGRMDREIEIRLPDTEALEKIFHFYTRNEVGYDRFADSTQFRRLAALSAGYSGADVARAVRNASRYARTEQRPLDFGDLLREVTSTDSTKTFTDEQRRRIAIHEAGHCLVMFKQRPYEPPTVMLGGSGDVGGTVSGSMSGRRSFTASEIDEILVALLGGRAAEEVICGQPSSGAGGSASSDLAQATRIATLAETSWGLGELGLVWSNPPDAISIDGLFAMRPGVAATIHRRLDAAYQEAKQLVSTDRVIVTRLAKALLNRTVLLPTEVAQIITGTEDRGPPPPKTG